MSDFQTTLAVQNLVREQQKTNTILSEIADSLKTIAAGVEEFDPVWLSAVLPSLDD